MKDRALHRVRTLRLAATVTPVAALALGTACAQSPPPPAAPPSPPAQGQPMTATMRSIGEAARADAARRTGLPLAEVRVVSAESVTWRNGSLGCPEPGMAYTDALVPGYRIRVAAGTQELDYHASKGGQLLFCPSGRAVEPLPASDV